MSDLERSRTRTPRRKREQRAYTLVLVGGGAGVIAVVGGLLAILGIVGFGIPFLAAIVAVACYFMFKRSVS